MALRDTIRNLFYAMTHANELVEKERLFDEKEAFLSVQNEQRLADKQLKEMANAVYRVVSSYDLTPEQLEELYNAVKPHISGSVLQWVSFRTNEKFGYLCSFNHLAEQEYKRILHTNTLVRAGILPKDRMVTEISQNTQDQIREILGTEKLPYSMPVGKIDYLGPGGKVGDTVKFYDAVEFLNQIHSDNYSGVPMSISVYSEPKSGTHIDTAWRSMLDPAPQGFQVIPWGSDGECHSSIAECNIPAIIGEMSDNAWNGKLPLETYIHAGKDIICIEGYGYEPSYEFFSATADISLNGKILYGVNSRNVDAYKNEVYHTGIYKTPEEAIAHIEKHVQASEYIVSDCKIPPLPMKAALDQILGGAEFKRSAVPVQNNRDTVAPER